jgi:hypothetical protein
MPRVLIFLIYFNFNFKNANTFAWASAANSLLCFGLLGFANA